MNQARHDSIPTRHSLLNRLKDWRDEASWREFFELYWELIYNVARKAGLNDAEAQKVVQETVIAVAKKHRRVRDGRPARLIQSLVASANRLAHCRPIPRESESRSRTRIAAEFREGQARVGRIHWHGNGQPNSRSRLT